jgi:hypothetical protein
MTTKDSAEDKLIASIQKTRSGTPSGSKSVKKAVPKKSSAASKKKNPVVSGRAASTQERKQALIDLFQHGRRVWPD